MGSEMCIRDRFQEDQGTEQEFKKKMVDEEVLAKFLWIFTMRQIRIEKTGTCTTCERKKNGGYDEHSLDTGIDKR